MSNERQIVDMHMHVGLKGDSSWKKWGHFSPWYQKQIVFKIFLQYARIHEHEVCDRVLHEKTLEIIEHSGVDKVVCLPLDHVYDRDGNAQPQKSHMWVANDYITGELKKALPDKVLPGASVHPYDKKFKQRVEKCVEEGAVLMKWLPSAQQIDLGDKKTGDAMEFLASCGKDGKPLPLLLHVGPEHAIPSTDKKTSSYDFLSWTWKDKVTNFFRFKKRWYTPQVDNIRSNLEKALAKGAVIIFAHCGLPYFVSGALGRFFEHSDFKSVKHYLTVPAGGTSKGKCCADVSATCTPFRKKYFKEIAKLPADRLFFGSDFPGPVFELSADFKENLRDLEAVLKGDFSRIVIPQDNLIDVNLRELKYVFPGHPMFFNFGELIKGN